MNNIDIVNKFQNLLSKKDLDEALGLVAEKAIWHSDEIGAPWSGIHHGKNDIKAHFDSISGTTKYFKRHHQDFIQADDLVIEIGSLSCTLNKTGEPFSTEYVCLWKVVDHEIVSYRIFEDSLKLHLAYYKKNDTKKHGLTFDKSVAKLKEQDEALIIHSEQISKHFPAPSPGAIHLFDDVSMSVGMVKTEDYPSYPHKNDYDEVHYVIKGSAKFRHGSHPPSNIKAGDVVYVKAKEEHEWFECSKDFELIFVQSKQEIA